MPKEPASLSDDQLEDLIEEADDFGEGLEDKSPRSPEGRAEASEDFEDPEDIEEVSDEDSGPTFRDILSQRNINVPDDVDEREYLGQILDHFGQVNQRVQAERQQYQQQLLQYQHMLAQQQRPPVQEPPKPAELKGLLTHWKKVPEWDDNWAQLVRRNEQNELVPIPGAAPDLPQRIRERQLWEERAQRLFFENPQQFIYEAMQAHPEFSKPQQELQQLRQEFAAYQDRVQASQVVNELRGTIWQDGNTHGPMTPAGQAYVAVVEAMKNAGITDTGFVNQIGQIAMSGYAQQQAPPPKTPSEKKKAAQLKFQKDNAAKSPNKSRKSAPARRFDGDIDEMNRHSIALMRKAGIDPHAMAEVR